METYVLFRSETRLGRPFSTAKAELDDIPDLPVGRNSSMARIWVPTSHHGGTDPTNPPQCLKLSHVQSSSVPMESGNRSFPPLLLGIDISKNPKIQCEACSINHNAILPVGKGEKLITVDSACHPIDAMNPHAHPIVIMGTVPIRTVTLFDG